MQDIRLRHTSNMGVSLYMCVGKLVVVASLARSVHINLPPCPINLRKGLYRVLRQRGARIVRPDDAGVADNARR